MKLKELDRLEKRSLNNKKNIDTLYKEVLLLHEKCGNLHKSVIDLVERLKQK